MTDTLGLYEDNPIAKLRYQPRPLISYVEMSDDELAKNVGGVLAMDVESFANYFLIAFKDVKSHKVVTFQLGDDFKDDEFNIDKLHWIMHNYICVGFNTLTYDVPMLWLSYVHQDTVLLKEASDDLIAGSMQHDLQNKHHFRVFKTNHIDLIEVCPLHGSLKLYGARLHAKRIQDLPWAHEQSLEGDQIALTRDYCINNDLDITILLYDNLTEQLNLRRSLCVEYDDDFMSLSDAQIAELIIVKEIKKLTKKSPSRPKLDPKAVFKFKTPDNLFFQTDYMKGILKTIESLEFRVTLEGRLIRPKIMDELQICINDSIYRMGVGGLHSSEKSVAIFADNNHELHDRDVAGYYPRIILNLKLFPIHLGKDFLIVYDGLNVRRLTAKQIKDLAKSESLKVTVNGTFGKSGSPGSFIYSIPMFIHILLGGQLYLLMLIEHLEIFGIPVVSANTDGVVMRCPKDKIDLMKVVIEEWEKTTHFVTEETQYKAVYSRDVNSYLAIKTNGEVKGKNLFYDPWRSKNARDAYWRFQKNPARQICCEAVEEFIVKGVPISKTIRECKDIRKFIEVRNVAGGAHKNGDYLGKVVRWYIGSGELGSINYITDNSLVANSQGAIPLMDLPDKLPSNLNFSYYVKKAEEMLLGMGLKKR